MKNKETIIKLETLLKNQKIKKIVQHNEKEVILFFESGRRFFVDSKSELEFSVTE